MKKLLDGIKENAFILASLCAFLGGLTPVAAKIALEVFPVFTLLFIRFLTATLFLLPFVMRSKELGFGKFKSLWKVALLGSVNPVLFIIGIQFTQASVTPFIYSCLPALTALYLYFANGNRISMRQVGGIILGLLGVGLIVFLPLLQESAEISFQGNAIIFIAAIAFMFYGVASGRYLNTHKATPMAMTFYFCLVTMLIMVPFTIWEMTGFDGGISGLLAEVTMRHWLGAVATGVLGTSGSYLVYQYAIKAGGELAASLFTYLQPVATILLAVLFLGEQVELAFLVGGVLAIAGAQVARKG